MMLLEVIETGSKLSRVLDSLVEQGAALGWTLIKALLVFIVGRFLISMINKLVQRVLLKRKIDPSIKTFVGSLIHIILMILLIISVVGALGVHGFLCCFVGFSRCCNWYGFERQSVKFRRGIDYPDLQAL